GQLGELAVAVAVDATVADVADDGGVVEKVEGHHRGPHALAAGVALRLLVDLGVGQENSGDHAVGFGGDAVLDLVGPGDRLHRLGVGEVLEDGVDRQLAGDVAGGVPAHAVCDDGQPGVRGQVDGVLVVVPLAPDI